MDDFAEFYAAQFRPLTLQLVAYTGELALAEELVQEAFSRAVPRWTRLRQYDDPAAWVRRVAFNLANSRWRRLRIAQSHAHHQREHHVEGPSPDRVAVVRALATLPEKHRRALVLYYVAGLAIDEIAQHEKASPGTVKSWLHRGRTALAGQLRDAEEANHV